MRYRKLRCLTSIAAHTESTVDRDHNVWINMLNTDMIAKIQSDHQEIHVVSDAQPRHRHASLGI